ncbi:hypothetical protein N7466_010785 [Penicillium verhagenii]|uniref:uncharacterized protein n=1 Tax=Penicillium verhagenii TaxID=1562060 RepID=UPI0025453AB1|nr:uncharacterized protein N7466_010785 [Penicillium verhagenii]KAJ5917231.1 hypothetical protein N7466_010785 [Penicillium verhagenii]
MVYMSLVSAAFAFLCLGASSAAPVTNDRSVIWMVIDYPMIDFGVQVEYCDDGSSQECDFQSVNMDECTALNNA